MQPQTPQPPEEEEPSSRSARRREALDVLWFAGQLAVLPAASLARMQLPDDVREAVTAVQHTPSHIAHKRELAYLAKRIRTYNEATFAPARATLANDRAAHAREADALHHIEELRSALLGENGTAALAELTALHPTLDRQQVRALIRRAQRELAAGQPPRAQRALFRFLRELNQT